MNITYYIDQLRTIRNVLVSLSVEHKDRIYRKHYIDVSILLDNLAKEQLNNRGQGSSGKFSDWVMREFGFQLVLREAYQFIEQSRRVVIRDEINWEEIEEILI